MTVTRFLSSLLFSSAFIWVAVEFFDVETEVVYVLFIFSLILTSLLSQLRAGVHDLADAEHRVPPMDDQAGGPEADRSQPSKGDAGPDSKSTAP